MRRPGRKNLKGVSLLRDDPTPIHRMLLPSLLSVLVFCGCNKTPPRDKSASSASPGGTIHQCAGPGHSTNADLAVVVKKVNADEISSRDFFGTGEVLKDNYPYPYVGVSWVFTETQDRTCTPSQRRHEVISTALGLDRLSFSL
jgi:hypothetical protein